MENPRFLILNRIRQNTNNIIIDELEHNNKNYILSSVIDGIYYTLIDYIQLERRKHIIGHLEYNSSTAFIIIHIYISI